MRLRKIADRLGFWLHGIVALVPCRALKAFYRSGIIGCYKTIALADANSDPLDDEMFLAVAQEALALVEREDPRRFRRIQREIPLIVNVELTSGAAYNRQGRFCEVDFSRYLLEPNGEGREWYVACFASTVVHEATHGCLESLGFPYTKRTRVQIERICNAEEKRFATRLKSDQYDFAKDLVPNFNEDDWHTHWNWSGWQAANALLLRIRQARAEATAREVEASRDAS